GADHVAGHRNADLIGRRDVRQQAHDDELARSDAEAADGKGYLDQDDGKWRKRGGTAGFAARTRGGIDGNGGVGHGAELIIKCGEAIVVTRWHWGSGPSNDGLTQSYHVMLRRGRPCLSCAPFPQDRASASGPEYRGPDCATFCAHVRCLGPG